MNVLVPIKQVAGVGDEFTIEGTAIAPSDLEYELNEWDEYAIEAGVQLSEAGIADEVVGVTIGPQRAEETIRTALAKGVDRAIRIWDDPLEEGFPDVSSRVSLLAAVLEEVDPDLVLAGVQASDGGFAATGVALAERVGYEHAAVVNDLEIDIDVDTDAGAGVAHVRRELEGGIEELTDVDLPAVLTIQTGLNEPRYASLRGIRQAQTKEIDVRTLDDLGVEPADVESTLTLTGMVEPESESDAEMIEGSPADAAVRLAEVLHEKGVGAS